MLASILSVGASVGSAGTAAANAAAPAKSVEAFSRSMERHSTPQVAANQPAAGQPAPASNDAVPAVPASSPAVDTQAQSRAREALELTGPSNHGDAILGGLQRLRGIFDKQEGIVSRLMSGSAANTGTMLAMQMEVANFSLLVEVTSKLTGKSTQAFDTLMKGQ